MITCKKCKTLKPNHAKGLCRMCYQAADKRRAKERKENEREIGFSQLKLGPRGKRKKKRKR